MTTTQPTAGGDERVRALVRRATTPRPADATTLHPARYAVRTAHGTSGRAAAVSLVAAFAPDAVQIEPLSPDEPDGLLLILPARVFSADAAAAFALGYAIAELPGVETAEPDLATDFFPEPDTAGPRAESAEALGCNVGPGAAPADRRWAVAKVRAPQAWALSEQQGRPSRGAGVVIAQPDTGVVPHRELDPDRRVPSFDVIDGDDDPTDPLEDRGNPGHGTGTGSVVVSGESHDVVGAAPRALHMPIRCTRAVVQLSQVNLTKAIDGAVRRGAHVITMSLGGLPSWALARAVARAVEADVIVLAAAGNCVRTVVWPARYDDCIAVAGTNHEDRPWRGSCRGAAVDLSGPAENVYRARPDGARPPGESTLVLPGEGTSFAVALTAGAAACWLAHHGRDALRREARARGETLQAMFKRLVQGTARRAPGWDATEFGAGILDVRALLEAPLDLNVGREDATTVDAADTARPVRTLVAERLGPEAVDRALDYERYGPELAYVLLREAALRPVPAATTGAAPRAEGGLAVAVHSSKALRSAVTNSRLGAHLEALAGSASVPL